MMSTAEQSTLRRGRFDWSYGGQLETDSLHKLRVAGVLADRVHARVDAQEDEPGRLLLDRDGGLASERGQAARLCLYLFERDAAVGLLRSG